MKSIISSNKKQIVPTRLGCNLFLFYALSTVSVFIGLTPNTVLTNVDIMYDDEKENKIHRRWKKINFYDNFHQ